MLSFPVKLADGKSVETTHVLTGCKLKLSGHTFDIDLIPFSLGSFDAVVGIDWLSENRAEIICHEKIFHITTPSGELISIQGEKSSITTSIITLLKAQKYLRKGHPAILAHIVEKPWMRSESKTYQSCEIFRKFSRRTCQDSHQ